MKEDIISGLKCTFTTHEDFTEGKYYHVYFSPSGDYILSDRNKRIPVEVIGLYGDFVQD